jgi:capsular exopolysaccharide synthesis family protein
MTTLPQTTSVRLPRPAGGGALAVPGTMAASAPPAVGMTAGDVWRVLRAHIPLIIFSLIIGGGLGFAANWYLAKHYSRYTATGLVQIAERRTRGVAEGGGETMLDMSSLVVELKSQARLLHTETLFSEVLNRPAVRDTTWFKQFMRVNADGIEAPDIAAAKDDLSDKLSITPSPETKLIEVNFTYSNPQDCDTIIEEVIEQHLQDQNKFRAEVLSERTGDLAVTKSALQLKNNQRQDQIAHLQEELNAEGLNTMANHTSPRDMQLMAYAEEQKTARYQLNEAKSQLDTVKSRLTAGEDPPEVEEKIQEDHRIQTLRDDVDALQAQISGMDVGENNPRFQSAQHNLAMYQKQLDDAEAERRVLIRADLTNKLEQAQQAAQMTLDAATQKMEDSKAALGQLDFKLFQFYQAKQDQEVITTQLQTIDKQLEDADEETRGKDLATIQWAQHPLRPDTPSFPKLVIFLPAGAALGLILSLAIAFARELMDQTVRSPRDITRVGQMTLLGMIPHEDDDPQVANVPLPLVISQAPTSIMAEQFRQVRTRLQHASSLETTRSLLVTSPGPGDGKSTVATNLAAGLALNGRRILLVDANFRRPQLQKIFNVGNDLGFSTALAAPENFETAVHQTSVMNLDVIPTGPKPANPTELMESQLLIDFIDKALEEYDHVIFDSGPLLFVSETVALAPRVDGVVTVVRARANSRGLLQRMRDSLRQLKAEHLGIILNAVRSQGGGYYGRNIKTYYEYQNG